MHHFSSTECEAHITFEPKQIHILFKLFNVKPDSTIKYSASAPAVRNNSFSGSGLPYPSEEVAMENTSMRGKLQLDNNQGEISLDDLPNSYYLKLGSTLIPPSVKIEYEDYQSKKQTTFIVLCDPIPYRTLTYDFRRKDVMFYDRNLPVRSQEQILRDSAYDPSYDVRKSFWNLRPPY